MWRLKRRLGSRTLRFGDRGPDVRELHAFLRLQGYDLGDEDHYGYLTKDAVQQFQREHGLAADGIAGRRFFALALKEELPIRRRVHVVQPQEKLEEIASCYGVGPEAFGRSGGRGSLYPGQRLVFFDREVWGICRGEGTLEQGAPTLTGVIVSVVSSAPAEVPCLLRPKEFAWDVVRIHSALKTPRRRKAAAKLFLGAVEQARGSCGLFLPWSEVAQLDGVRYIKLLSRLRRALDPGKMLWVELGPGVPPWRIWGGVDYSQVNDLVDRVVLRLPRPAQPGPILAIDPVRELLRSVRQEVHSWKILLDVPVYAVEWELGGESPRPSELSYQAARARALRRGARLKTGEGGEPFYSYHSRGARHEIHLPQLGVLAEICTLINRLNLAGIILDGLGLEDSRIWEVLRSHFRTAALNISQE
ncbi:MAG TPA: peptidoglycan-binding protein [Limnochordia bacterium]|nr:peptidoglycan-binding protein [Limnochordia bacterium]